MGKKINFQPISVVSASPVNLLNGAFASLSGPIGFTPTQPRIIVKAISVFNLNDYPFVIQKNGVTVFAGPDAGTISTYPLTKQFVQDIVLEASDFLSATSQYGVTVNIDAEIEF